MHVRYDPAADRILWQLRTRGGELFSSWLTRRMVLQWWPRFQDLVGQTTLPHSLPTAAVLPEAREMLAQAARERPLPNADFASPFNPEPVALPLGSEPLLPTVIEMGLSEPGPGLMLRLRDANGRSLGLQLAPDLASALLRLIDQALADAQWGEARPAPPTSATDAPAPRVLN